MVDDLSACMFLISSIFFCIFYVCPSLYENGREDLYVLDYLITAVIILLPTKKFYVYVFLIPTSCAERGSLFYVWIVMS